MRGDAQRKGWQTRHDKMMADVLAQLIEGIGEENVWWPGKPLPSPPLTKPQP